MKTSARPQPKSAPESSDKEDARLKAEKRLQLEAKNQKIGQARRLVGSLAQRISEMTAQQLVMIPAILNEETLDDAHWSLLHQKPQLQDASDDEIENKNPITEAKKLDRPNHLRYELPELRKKVLKRMIDLDDLDLCLNLWENSFFTELNGPSIDRNEALQPARSWIFDKVESLDLSQEKDRRQAEIILKITKSGGNIALSTRNKITLKMAALLGIDPK